MAWDKIKIERENREWVEAQAPIIVSASRSTDIPAFYSDWFFHRLKVGYSAWTNPFNGVKSYVSYQNTRFIVFWSKNPYPLISHLDYLKERNTGCYVQYSLNDYVQERLEKGVPPLDFRIKTFKQLVDKLGKGHVIWRFDPLLLTKDISIESLLQKIENIGDQLQGYTEKLVFGFADILLYRKVKSNLEKNNIPYIDWTHDMMCDFAQRLVQLNDKWGYELATCGEKFDFEKMVSFGIGYMAVFQSCEFGVFALSFVADETLVHLLVSPHPVLEKALFLFRSVVDKSPIGLVHVSVAEHCGHPLQGF